MLKTYVMLPTKMLFHEPMSMSWEWVNLSHEPASVSHEWVNVNHEFVNTRKKLIKYILSMSKNIFFNRFGRHEGIFFDLSTYSSMSSSYPTWLVHVATNICKVKAHYTVHKLLSQGNLCKILKFVIGHMNKYSQLWWKKTQHYMVMYNIITLYGFHT
jgi:hypothetical protein